MWKLVCFICVAAFVATNTMAYSGEYIPKAIYMIDENGRAHDVVYINNFERFKRQSGAYSGSYSSSSSAGSTKNTKGKGFNPAALDSAFYDLANGNVGPQLFSRFGEGSGPGVSVGGTAAGPNGAFSQSQSTSNNGHYTYSHKAGQY